MKNVPTSQRIPIPHHPLIGTVVLMIVSAISGRPAFAQCPPVPTSYPNGVIEGLIADALSTQAAVAAEGQGNFIVIFTRPIPAPSVNGVLVHRFSADGACICDTRDPGTDADDDFCLALLTVIEGVGRGVHQRPSIALNRGADGRAEWFASRGFRT